ncbi:hypothetical protein GCM10007079_37450 [Nocardiopsis terrae]|nr:hypothetical protein GCM10007079_37450 [Nocardiopsis terrae]
MGDRQLGAFAALLELGDEQAEPEGGAVRDAHGASLAKELDIFLNSLTLDNIELHDECVASDRGLTHSWQDLWCSGYAVPLPLPGKT